MSCRLDGRHVHWENVGRFQGVDYGDHDSTCLTIDKLYKAKALMSKSYPVSPVEKIMTALYFQFQNAVLNEKFVEDLTPAESVAICHFIGRVEMVTGVVDGKATISTKYPCKIERIQRWYRVTEVRPE